MNFKEWKDKYYPKEKGVETLGKMSHAFTAGHIAGMCLLDDTEKQVSDKKDVFCCLGPDHNCQLSVNRGYCAAGSCQYQVQEDYK